MFLIPCDNWMTFFSKVYRYGEVFFKRHVLAFFKTSDLKEAHILFYVSIITAQY